MEPLTTKTHQLTLDISESFIYVEMPGLSLDLTPSGDNEAAKKLVCTDFKKMIKDAGRETQ